MNEVYRVIKAASWRLLIIDLLKTLTMTTTIALTALIALRLVQKLTPIELPWGMVFIGAGVAAVIASVVWSLIRRERELEVARHVDERAGLRESLSTAICVERADDPWARVVVETASDKARRVVLRDSVPIESPKLWPMVVAAAIALAAVWWLPRYDLTGVLAAKAAEDERQAEIEQVKVDVATKEKKIEDKLRKAGLDLDKLGIKEDDGLEGPEASKPEEIKRTAIKKLTALSDQLKQLRQGKEGQTLEAMKDAMRKLRPPGEGPMTDLYRSMARGNFTQAKEAIDNLSKQLGDGSLSKEESEQVKKQLENLSKQLEKLAENKDALAEQLAKAGVTPEQAKQLASNPQALQQALEQMESLSDEQKQALMQAAQAQMQACEACEGMAGAMGQMAQNMSQQGMGQQGLEGMQSLGDQLSAMEMMASDMQNLDAALGECQSQLSSLGESMCDGSGMGQCFGEGLGNWAEGATNSQGMGSGGPGKGQGAGPDAQETDFVLKREKENVANRGGPIIGTTLVYGSQVRGDSVAEFAAAVAAAEEMATEAIETRRVPREMENAVQSYFGRLEKLASEKQGEADDSEPAPAGEDAG